jgi:hypothetical protein
VSFRFEKPRKLKEVHPVWRGVGCLLIVLVPVFTYSLSLMLLQENARRRWVAFPRDWLVTVELPGIGPVPYFWLRLGLTVVVSVVFYALLTMGYALFYRLFGPPRYGPLDSPPPRVRRRPKKSR